MDMLYICPYTVAFAEEDHKALCFLKHLHTHTHTQHHSNANFLHSGVMQERWCQQQVQCGTSLRKTQMWVKRHQRGQNKLHHIGCSQLETKRSSEVISSKTAEGRENSTVFFYNFSIFRCWQEIFFMYKHKDSGFYMPVLHLQHLLR